MITPSLEFFIYLFIFSSTVDIDDVNVINNTDYYKVINNTDK